MWKLLILIFAAGVFSQTLQLSKHQLGTVESSKYVYYTLPDVPISENSKLQFVTFPLSGDLEMYVSNVHSRPNRNQYEWKSTFTGPNTIAIDMNLNISAPFYIGIFGVWSSKFVILSYLQNHTEIFLENEQPLIAMVEPH
jgi:hypothetical protein